MVCGTVPPFVYYTHVLSASSLQCIISEPVHSNHGTYNFTQTVSGSSFNTSSYIYIFGPRPTKFFRGPSDPRAFVTPFFKEKMVTSQGNT